ncbi:MAG: hypothetical protein GJT30_01265 [Geobacter sp.]|nr:hypothetical protein [Geobacter sp.]
MAPSCFRMIEVMLLNDMILFYDFVDIHYHICLDDYRRIHKILPSFYCRLVQAAFFCPCFWSGHGGSSRERGVEGCRQHGEAAGLAAATQPDTACQRFQIPLLKNLLVCRDGGWKER